MSKKKRIFQLGFAVLIIINIISWVRFCQDYRQMTRNDMHSIMQDVQAAIAEVDPDMKMTRSIEDVPVTFSDDAGNTIIYHCLTTTYYGEHSSELAGIDMEAIHLIIDPETADSSRSCNVNEADAMLYQKNNRSYLCWTLSEEFSFVIEYTPSAVAEEDIFRMAEDLALPEPEEE